MPDETYNTPDYLNRTKTERDAGAVIDFLNETHPGLGWKTVRPVLRALLPLAYPQDLLEHLVVMHMGAVDDVQSAEARSDQASIEREFSVASRRLLKRDTEKTLDAIAKINREFNSHKAVRQSSPSGTYFILTLRS